MLDPVLKWPGGKRQLLGALHNLLPGGFGKYCEPFVGGGAMLFSLCPKVAVIGDMNQELVSMYSEIKENVEELVCVLSQMRNREDVFYSVRGWDRDKEFWDRIPRVVKAARLIFLNKTCFNGLYRVNSRGEFNSPYGWYEGDVRVNIGMLRAVSKYLRESDVELKWCDFSETLNGLESGSFVFLDPPYLPVSDTAKFVEYTKGGFGKSDYQRLYDCCVKMSDGGVKFMLTCGESDFVKDLFGEFNQFVFQARRSINSSADGRSGCEEFVIWNY